MNAGTATLGAEPVVNLNDAAIPYEPHALEDVADTLPIQCVGEPGGVFLQYDAAGKAILIVAPPKIGRALSGVELLQDLVETQDVDMKLTFLSGFGLGAADTAQHETREIPLTRAKGEVLLILDGQYGLPPKVEDGEASIKSIHKVTLNDLCNAAYRLACPIEVSVEERGDEDFIACLYDAGVYGYGSTIPEALDDLRALLIDQYEHLVTREPRGVLGPVLRRQLRVLERFVERLSGDD